MKINKIFFMLTCLWILISSQSAFAQNSAAAEEAFAKIEEGFIKGDVNKLEPYLKDKVFISLFTGTAGYFSRNHAVSLLDDFFTYHKTSGFNYVSTITDSETPFASGKFKYFYKAILKNSNVFISLKKHKENWIISQITID